MHASIVYVYTLFSFPNPRNALNLRNCFSGDFYNTLFSFCSIYSFFRFHCYFSHYIASLPLFYFACCMILWSVYLLCYLCRIIALAAIVICRLFPTSNKFYLIFYLCICIFSRSWRPELALVTQFTVYSILANTSSIKLLLIYESNYKQCNRIFINLSINLSRIKRVGSIVISLKYKCHISYEFGLYHEEIYLLWKLVTVVSFKFQ